MIARDPDNPISSDKALIHSGRSGPRGRLPGTVPPIRQSWGQEEFFTLVGQPVPTRTEAPPPLDADAQAAFIAKSKALAPDYKTELLPPPGAK
jgi:hypothetical protein